MKKVLVILMALLVTMSSSVIVKASSQKSNTTVVDTIELKVTPDSDKVLKSVKAIKLSDGSVKIQATNSKKAGTSPEAFSIEANLQSKTYKTKVVKVNEYQTSSGDLVVTAVEPFTSTDSNFSRDTVSPMLNTWQSGSQWAQFSSGLYRARVQTFTQDQPGYDLAETNEYLWWSIYNGSVTYSSRNLTAWGANPSALGTHWYVDSVYYDSSPYYGSGNSWVAFEGEANYHNYDFMDPSQPTYARHWIQLQGLNDGWYNWSIAITATGEYWSILKGYVVAY